MNTHAPDDELLSAYADGELSVEESGLVERWLEANPHERRRIEHFKTIGGAIRSLPQKKLPAEFQTQVMQAIEREMLLPSSSGANGAVGRQQAAAGSAATTKKSFWLRFGVRVLAPVAATALGLVFVFSNLMPEAPGMRSREELASATERDLALAPRSKSTSGESLQFDAPAGGGMSPLQSSEAPAPRSLQKQADAPLSPSALPLPTGNVPEVVSNRKMAAGRTEARSDLSEFKTTLSEALGEQQKRPELTVLLTIAVSEPQSGEPLAANQALALRKILAGFYDRRFEALERSVTLNDEERARYSLKGGAKPGAAGESDKSPTTDYEEMMMLVVGDPEAFAEALLNVLERDADESIILEVAKTEVLELTEEVKKLIGDFSDEAEDKYLNWKESSEPEVGQTVEDAPATLESPRPKTDVVAGDVSRNDEGDHPGVIVEFSLPHSFDGLRLSRDPAPAAAVATTANHDPENLPSPPGEKLEKASRSDPARAMRAGGGQKSMARSIRKMSPAEAALKKSSDNAGTIQANDSEPPAAASRVLIQFITRPNSGE